MYSYVLYYNIEKPGINAFSAYLLFALDCSADNNLEKLSMNSFLHRIIFRKTLTGKSQPIIIPDKQKIEFVQARSKMRSKIYQIDLNFGIELINQNASISAWIINNIQEILNFKTLNIWLIV